MTLYVLATPIGNLQDISARAKQILASADLILAEDTRVTKKLLASLDLAPAIVSLHQHSTSIKLTALVERLSTLNCAVLVSDAGTPGIADPGAKFLDLLYASEKGIKVIPLPGPSAIAAALSVSGFNADRFCFLGFSPQKKGRQTFFRRITDSKLTQVFFSSPHRIIKDLEQLRECGFGQRRLLVGREMTKLFESYYRGNINEVLAQAKSAPQKGEYTVVIEQLWKLTFSFQ